MDSPKKRVKPRIIIAVSLFVIFVLCVLVNVYYVGDPPYTKLKYAVEIDTQNKADETFNPEIEETYIKIKPEAEAKKEQITPNQTLETEDNIENISNINEEIPPIDENAYPIETDTSESDTEVIETEETENIENITVQEIPHVVEKFIPIGPYASPDFSVYSEDELKLINLVLSKIEENKNTDKKEELINIDFTLSLENYYKVATYFYVYYGQKRAVNETFDLVNHTSWHLNGTKETKYMVRMRYEDIREFEKELQIVKNKADEILSNFEAGSDVYILRQISEYLRQNIVYTPDRFDIKSALIDGQSVCNGYALAFNLLANRAGIKTDMCIGKVPDGGMHAWNRVTMSDGNVYYYDITFFDTDNPNDKYTHSPTPLHTTDFLINDYTNCWFK